MFQISPWLLSLGNMETNTLGSWSSCLKAGNRRQLIPFKYWNGNSGGFSSLCLTVWPPFCSCIQVLVLQLMILSHLGWLARQRALLHILIFFFLCFIYSMQSGLFPFSMNLYWLYGTDKHNHKSKVRFSVSQHNVQKAYLNHVWLFNYSFSPWNLYATKIVSTTSKFHNLQTF